MPATQQLGARIRSVVLDADDPGRLARFYAQLLDRPITRVDGRWFDIRLDDGLQLSFQHDPDHRPVTWPDGDVRQQLHLDIVAEGPLDQAEERAIELGAVSTGHPRPGQPEHRSYRTLLDPAGHPLCLEAPR